MHAELAQPAGDDANSVPSAREKPQLASLLGYEENKLGAGFCTGYHFKFQKVGQKISNYFKNL